MEIRNKFEDSVFVDVTPPDARKFANGNTYLERLPQFSKVSVKRRRRTVIAPEQLAQLEYLFSQDPWPSRERKEELARRISMPTRFVNIWFQNKRSRIKKLFKEQSELEEIERRASIERPKTKLGADMGFTNDALSVNKFQNTGVLKKILPKPHRQEEIADQSQSLNTSVPKESKINGNNTHVGLVNVNDTLGIANEKPLIKSNLSRSTKSEGILDVGLVEYEDTRTGFGDVNKIVTRLPAHSNISVNPQEVSFNKKADVGTCKKLTSKPSSRRVYKKKKTHKKIVEPRINLHRCLIAMMAFGEGVIFPKLDPIHDTVSINSHLYGIKINDTHLKYTSTRGFKIIKE